MVDKYLGQFFFNDPNARFINQKDRLQNLTEYNDVALGTMGKDKQYLALAVSKPNELSEDIFQKSSNGKEVACVKADYNTMDPQSVHNYVDTLIGLFNHNRRKQQPQSYYIDQSGVGFKEISKDEFYKG